ncbi:MAG: elongation factor 4 [Bacteroides sp.]|nr:MAG: elongation factor 4 [Bacteroides sp.]
MKNIRNFCIIAHIDHGKSTIADKLIQETNTLKKNIIQNQVLDNMDLEREKGITIKSHAIQMNYQFKGDQYILNLIDTPGHVDFSYEVLRSINVCEGALLVVDATQGIQAQTIANLRLAINQNLKIIPILNKIDIVKSSYHDIISKLEFLLKCDKKDIILASGKTGLGINLILQSIIQNIPSPNGNNNETLKAVIFDSFYDIYKGIIVYCKILQGYVCKGDKLKLNSNKYHFTSEEVGILKIKRYAKNSIETGNVGYIVTGIKNPNIIKIGDLIINSTSNYTPNISIIENNPTVYAGVYPINNKDYSYFKTIMDKLKLNDASIEYKPEFSNMLGLGLRCGFLGMLHMDIIRERLIREFNINVMMTMPSVSYFVYDKFGKKNIINNPSDIPTQYKYIEEPFVMVSIITKYEFIGKVLNLSLDKRGIMLNQKHIDNENIEILIEIPLSEVVFDFYDKLKSVTKGYSTFNYYNNGYKKSNLSKIDIKLNDKSIDALVSLVHSEKAYIIGKNICKKLKDILPKKQFEIKIQAVINNKVIARETVKSVRKDVTSKCYGGDISRKKKLLSKQKKGKKIMQKLGNIEIPNNAFISIIKIK